MGCIKSRPRPKSMKESIIEYNQPIEKQVVRPVTTIYPVVNTYSTAQNQNHSILRQPSKKFHTSKIYQSVGVRSQVRKTTGSIITQEHTKAQYAFGASDAITKLQQNPNSLKAIQMFTIQDTVVLNRQSDYCQDIKNIGRPPILLANKQLLTYQLDTEDGVSKTPSVHTFYYRTVMRHRIPYLWNQSNIYNR